MGIEPNRKKHNSNEIEAEAATEKGMRPARLDLDIERLLMATNDLRVLTTRIMDKYVRKKKLTERGLDIISLIDVGLDRPSKLNKYFGIFPSAITLETDKLVEAGYITRRQDNKDRRVTILRLTAKGRKVREDSIALVNQAFRERLAGSSEEELNASVDFIRKVVGPIHPPVRPDNE